MLRRSSICWRDIEIQGFVLLHNIILLFIDVGASGVEWDVEILFLHMGLKRRRYKFSWDFSASAMKGGKKSGSEKTSTCMYEAVESSRSLSRTRMECENLIFVISLFQFSPDRRVIKQSWKCPFSVMICYSIMENVGCHHEKALWWSCWKTLEHRQSNANSINSKSNWYRKC